MPSGSHWKRTLSRWLGGTPPWIGDLDPSVLLVFLHLPKAGGTSLNGILARVYGRRFLNVSNHRRDWEDRRTNPDGVYCLAGHFPYGWHARLGRGRNGDEEGDGLFAGREVRYVTVVREPVERVKSYYHYVQATAKHRHHSATRGMSPREFFDFLKRRGDRELWDQQIRMMEGMPEDRFYLCAPLTRLAEFVSVLGAALGWPGDLEIPHANRTESRRDEGFGAELVEAIRQRSARDLALYEQVAERFEAKDFPAFRDAAGQAS